MRPPLFVLHETAAELRILAVIAIRNSPRARAHLRDLHVDLTLQRLGGSVDGVKWTY
jgi:hypothetical protein